MCLFALKKNCFSVEEREQLLLSFFFDNPSGEIRKKKESHFLGFFGCELWRFCVVFLRSVMLKSLSFLLDSSFSFVLQ